jgi:hypothetical protein
MEHPREEFHEAASPVSAPLTVPVGRRDDGEKAREGERHRQEAAAS